MSYTTLQKIDAVTVQRITPLDKRIVVMKFTSKISGYKTTHTDTALSIYTKLSLSGTTKRTKNDIYLYLKSNGILLDVSYGSGSITYSITTSDKDVWKAVNFLEELLFTTAISKTEYANTIDLMLEENREAHDNAKALNEIQFINTLYPKNSRKRKETLTESKASISKNSLPECRKISKSILRGEWSISIVGNKAAEESLLPLAEKIVLTAKRTQPEPELHVKHAPANIFSTIPGKTNVELKVGNVLPITTLDDDFIPFIFGLNVLGKVGGFSGRLMNTIREKEGLTYGIYARVETANTHTTGHWNIFTFFTGKDLQQGIKSIHREIALIIQKGITARELKVFKEILNNQFLISHESNSRRAALYHNTLLQGKNEKIVTTEMKRIQSLTTKEVTTALRKYIDPAACVYSGTGPVTPKGIGITAN